MSNELKPSSPSLRERLVGAMQNLVGGSANARGTASDFANNAGPLLDMIPGVSNVLGANDAYRSYESGHPVQAAMSAIGALPVPGAAVESVAGKALKGALKGVSEEARAAKAAGSYAPLTGLPQKALTIGGKSYIPGPLATAKDAAANYMKEAGLPYNPSTTYSPIDPEFSSRVAQAFDQMPHAPNDPAVQASYAALAKETKAQYQHVKATGLNIEPIPAGAPDPYAESPRLAVKDVRDNNHLYYFPSDQGFGSGPEAEAAMRDNPMLAPSGEKIGGKEVPYNDLFRVVHDYFGHIKEGVGFRAAGEDNAFQSHAAMYSPQALPAMAAETRGQNSWVNFGPHGDANRTASGADTVFAPQKIGMLPDWVYNERRGTPQAASPDAPSALLQPPNGMLNPLVKSKGPEDALANAVSSSKTNLQPGNSTVAFDPATRAWGLNGGVQGPVGTDAPLANGGRGAGLPAVPQTDLERYVPARGVPQRTLDLTANPNVRQQMLGYIQRGLDMAGGDWYDTTALRQRFHDVNGPEQGEQDFNNFMQYVAKNSPQNKVPQDIRQASYYYYLDKNGLPIPPEKGAIPSPHAALPAHQNGSVEYQNGIDRTLDTPKTASFGQNLSGNYAPVTIDLHATKLPAMLAQDPRWLNGEGKKALSSGTDIGTLAQDPKWWEASPGTNEYGHLENWWKGMADQLGITPAQAQAGSWVGGGNITGLGSDENKTFIDFMNDRGNITAQKTGQGNAQSNLDAFIRGQQPLLGLSGLAGAAGAGAYGASQMDPNQFPPNALLNPPAQFQ